MHMDSDIADLQARLTEAEDTLRAIRTGEVDAIVVAGSQGGRVYTLQSADGPYRTLIEEMHEGAAILTGDGVLLYGNRRFGELVAGLLDQAIGRSIDDVLPSTDGQVFADLRQAGGGQRRARLHGDGGRSTDVYVSMRPVRAENGEARWHVVLADLTELADAQHRREVAERESAAKDEFMAMLAHELRNPLSAITTAVTLIGAGDPHDHRTIRAQEIVRRQVGHLARLVDDLLDLSRVVTGKIALVRTPVDLAAIARHVAEGFANAGRQLEIETSATWVNADAVRLEQMLANLITNAVKYTVANGRVRVSVGTDGEAAVVRVQDNGLGISADLLPRVFDLFVQGDRTIDRAEGGLGIGLTLVRRLAELHDGRVAVESAGPGRGSTFTIRLPRIEAPHAAVIERAVPQGVVSRRVLLIEDNEDVREMLQSALELAGHSVLSAADGPSGLALLQERPVDVALIDIGLPGMDGYEVARRIRADASRSRMRLFALSGYGRQYDRDRARGAGFDRHLVKPLMPEQLNELLATGVPS